MGDEQSSDRLPERVRLSVRQSMRANELIADLDELEDSVSCPFEVASRHHEMSGVACGHITLDFAPDIVVRRGDRHAHFVGEFPHFAHSVHPVREVAKHIVPMRCRLR